MSRLLLVLLLLALPALASTAAADDAGPSRKDWLQLFNGKDLTGWSIPFGYHKNWKVVQGDLIGTPDVWHGLLHSDRSDYADGDLPRAWARSKH